MPCSSLVALIVTNVLSAVVFMLRKKFSCVEEGSVESLSFLKTFHNFLKKQWTNSQAKVNISDNSCSCFTVESLRFQRSGSIKWVKFHYHFNRKDTYVMWSKTIWFKIWASNMKNSEWGHQTERTGFRDKIENCRLLRKFLVQIICLKAAQ